jgi:hypothetical protein
MQSALTYTSNVAFLRSVNAVRMALNVVWISDITNADGTSIDPRWLSMPLHIPCRNKFTWPRKHHTTRKDWRRWRRFLSILCRHNSHILLHSTGRWHKSHRDWINTWECFTSGSEEILFIQDNNTATWRRHVIQQERRPRHFKRYHKEYLVYEELPSHLGPLKRASYKEYRNYVEVTATDELVRHRMQEEEAPSPWAGIYPSKASITIAIRNILNPVYLETTERLDILQQDFSTGQVIAVSDGSFMKANNGAATAWIIESQCKTQWIMASIHTPGPTEALSAYRSELTGLAAISVTLRILSQCCPSPPPHHNSMRWSIGITSAHSQ